MIIIDGKKLAEEIKEEIKEKLKNEKYKSISAPHLIIIRVENNNENSSLYINDNIIEVCKEVGIKCSMYKYKENISTEKLKNIISKLSLNPTVTGILIQTPLPEHIDERALIDEIDPIKDVNGVTCVQAGMLQLGIKDKYRLEPYIAKGIVRLLESITDLESKDVVVVGRSNAIGKPLAQLLQEKNATVTLCHSKTEDLSTMIQKSEIVILTTGKAKYFGPRYFYSAQDLIIIDAGINTDNDGKLCGDLNIDAIKDLYNARKFKYTSVLDGIRPMTLIELIYNVYLAYENQFEYIWNYCQTLKISTQLNKE